MDGGGANLDKFCRNKKNLAFRALRAPLLFQLLIVAVSVNTFVLAHYKTITKNAECYQIYFFRRNFFLILINHKSSHTKYIDHFGVSWAQAH